MPYATPTLSSPVLTHHSQGRPGHRRSYSSSPSVSFSNERGPGAFAGLGTLPRRQSPGISINTAPKFHLNTSSGSSSSDSGDEDGHPPPLKLKKPVSPSFGGVPFPKSSPLSSPVPGDNHDRGLLSPLSGLQTHITGFQSPSPRDSPLASPKPSPLASQTHLAPPLLRPSPSRTTSSPILLSNGKPLKSSLKSSSSTSNIPVHHQHHPHHPHLLHPNGSQPTHLHHHHHLRAQSAPSTPREDTITTITTTQQQPEPSIPNPPSTPSSASTSLTNSPTATPKNVHFPSLPTDLEHIRVFNKSAKPISFLRRSSDASRGPNGQIHGVGNLSEVEGPETETETETDRDQVGGSGKAWVNGYIRGWGVGGGSASGSGAGDRMGAGAGGSASAFPFPRVPSPPREEVRETLELELKEGYTVPSSMGGGTHPNAVVMLENVEMKSRELKSLKLELTVLVRNVAYEKQVVFRFTMDEWATTSEVGGKYLQSVYSTGGTSLSRSQAKTVGDVIGALGGGETGLAHSRCVSESALDTPPPYDRFLITISLSDYLHLENRVMWGVVRYTCPGKGEWWDNNGGKNFRIGWKKVKLPVPVTPSTSSNSTTATTAQQTGRERKAGVGVGRSLSAPPAPPASVVTTTATTPTTMTPPKPDVDVVKAQALQQRLSGFSLRNYVRPGTGSSPPLGKKEGIGLYWPWGSTQARDVRAGVKVEEKSDRIASPSSSSSPVVTPGGSASVEVLPPPLPLPQGTDYFSPSAPSVTGPTPTPTTPSSSRTSSMSSTTSDVPSLVRGYDGLRDGDGVESSTSSSSESLDSLMFGGSSHSLTSFKPHTRLVYGSPGDSVGIHDADIGSGYRPGGFGRGSHGGLGEDTVKEEEEEEEEEKMQMKTEARKGAESLMPPSISISPLASPLSPLSPASPSSPSLSSGSGSETERPLSSSPDVSSSSSLEMGSENGATSALGSTLTTIPVPATTVVVPSNGNGNGESEMLYKAFVKQWCFVESPRGGTPVMSPKPNGDVGAGVLGGEGMKVKV
ncbi:hypothetical protein E1B28_001879 [Marasmius oreades]|uniref:CBM21 domain-containing protein n=1 Tax=Marasmius oreades TaxID=181124 RepID=A0A9P7V4H9_9AGAR|nr:uncharacterized protein E1B28_001879 [Marasmius oreades]KAG7100099.1 hypothetical protein E1B28_001879 [Marasmius oreades]